MILDEYSISTRATNIYDSKTKDYFNEVLSNYNGGNYRSSVVMLWTVIVCDLLFKLEHLRDLKGDKTAEKILKDIKNMQASNTKDPKWELELLKKVSTQTQLIDNVNVKYLERIQEDRHLSAHPVIDSQSDLHRPNKDTVRSHIRNALDVLLTVPPYLARNISSDLMEDLSQNKDKLGDIKELKSYLNARYFKITNTSTQEKLFKDLWKMTFKVVNDKADENRNINRTALELLYQQNSKTFKDLVASDKGYFSKVADSGDPLVSLVSFLFNTDVSFYTHLDCDVKVNLRALSSINSDVKCLMGFENGSIEQHYRCISEWVIKEEVSVTQGCLKKLFPLSDSGEGGILFKDFLINYYIHSHSFNNADDRFFGFINYRHIFNIDDFKVIMEGVERNSQIYARYRFSDDRKGIIKQVLELESGFDFSNYEHFKDY